MSDPVRRLALAEVDAAAARQRLTATLGELQQRLAPKRLARLAARDIADAGSTAARTGADAVRNNPGAIAGLSALAGLFLARHRVAALFGRKRSRRTHHD